MAKNKGPLKKNGRHKCAAIAINTFPCVKQILVDYAAQEGRSQSSVLDELIEGLAPKLKAGGLESSTSVAK